MAAEYGSIFLTPDTRISLHIYMLIAEIISPGTSRALMALSPRRRLLLLLLLPILLLLLLHSTAASAPHRHRHGHHHKGMKSLHFALFQHETVNKTGYIIVNGVAGPGVSQTTTPFGTLFVFQDPMTLTANRTSRVVGTAEGTSITSALDGLRSISIAKITLSLKHLKGSISIVGGTHNIKPSDHPVVGGTGDFLFVQGYVRSSPVDLGGLTVVYKIEFHLYWPPYASSLIH